MNDSKLSNKSQSLLISRIIFTNEKRERIRNKETD